MLEELHLSGNQFGTLTCKHLGAVLSKTRLVSARFRTDPSPRRRRDESENARSQLESTSIGRRSTVEQQFEGKTDDDVGHRSDRSLSIIRRWNVWIC